MRTAPPSSILVMAAEMPLNSKISAETTMSESLSNRGVRAVRAIDLFPPTRSFTDSEMDEAIARERIDAILVLTLDEKGSSTGYMPQTTVPGTTTGTATRVGNTYYYQAQTTPSYSYGGFGVQYPTGNYSARLYNAMSKKMMWTASGSAIGHAYQNHSDLMPGIASGIVGRMVSDKIVNR